MRTAAILSIAVLAVALLGPPAVAPAWAHEGPASVLDLARVWSFGGASLLVALGAVSVLVLGRRRLALVLAVALPLLGFELGLHSVHHLDDREHASQCVLASAITHLNGTQVDAPRFVSPIEYTARPAPIPADIVAPRPSLAPHAGRAPPIIPA
jgi:hypothetical protein